ncbi:TPA: hypothetical protein ACH3X1_014710 [Trebouxia sp. C0004]
MFWTRRLTRLPENQMRLTVLRCHQLTRTLSQAVSPHLQTLQRSKTSSVLFDWLWVNVFCFHARGCTSSGLQWSGKASTCIWNAKERRGMLKTVLLAINRVLPDANDLTTTGPKERFNKDIKRAARKTNFKPGNTIAQVADQLYLNEAMEEVPARPDIKGPRHGMGAASSS